MEKKSFIITTSDSDEALRQLNRVISSNTISREEIHFSTTEVSDVLTYSILIIFRT